MTTWVETPGGGRDRGPSGMVRAWVEVLVRPRRFFQNGVAPGDQAPGLSFAIAIALIYVGGLLSTQPARVLGDDRIPVLADSVGLTAVFIGLVTAVVAAPAMLHLVSAIQTVLLMFTVDDRAGVSETVQVVGYATAPCVFAWLPIPGVAAVCGLYATGLLIVGLAVVHRTTLLRAGLAGVLPAVLVFGVVFGGLVDASAVAELVAG
ncbi:YIP1 family protein [Halohasta salina]|uniref:YIP1 family protein n=1 Tax=Halohasta salina TaxID=2961621 RepID=UPI0020A2A9EC|nr:YIP1 family protein [Halohasta salina]